MKIGVPKEIKEQEHRVALLPSVVYQLTRLGHEVFVERDAGAGAGFPDEEYTQAGGKILDDHSSVFAQGDLIIKVKEPLASEYPLLREGQILFT
jgi:alanine dehydrogenase